MTALRYRLRAWVRARWRVLGTLVLVVALAGGLALTLLAGAVRTITAPDRYTSSRGRVYDISLQQESGAPRSAELRTLDAVRRVELASFVFGGVTRGGSDEDLDALVFAGEVGPLNARLVAGRVPDVAAPGEFLATRGFVRAERLEIGARLRLHTYTQAQADAAGFDAPDPAGPALDATLVGVVDGPGDLDDGYQIALFPSSLLAQGDVGVATTVGAVALAPGASVTDLRRQLDELPNGDVFSLLPTESVSSTVRAAVNAQGQGLVVLGGIVAVVAVVVLGQLLVRQLRLGEGEQAALHALGVARRGIAAEPTACAVMVASAGVIGAAVAAYVASSVFPVDFVRRVEPDPGRRLDVPVVVGGAAVFAVALVGWVLLAVLAGTRRPTSVRPTALTELVAARVPEVRAGTAVRFAFGRGADGSRPATSWDPLESTCRHASLSIL